MLWATWKGEQEGRRGPLNVSRILGPAFSEALFFQLWVTALILPHPLPQTSIEIIGMSLFLFHFPLNKAWGGCILVVSLWIWADPY